MAARADIIASSGAASDFNGGGSKYLVKANNGAWYLFSSQTYRKSTDGGLTWGRHVTYVSGTFIACAVWYDRWSGISGDLIHVAMIESGADDVVYRSIDTASSDALGTQTTIFAGASTAANGGISITRTRGGNLLCVYNIDGGTEEGCARSTDVGATWGAVTSPTEAAANDKFVLLPGWAADNQDAMLIFHDHSANELSRKLYDDSANTWAETSISTGITHPAVTTTFPHVAATVDIDNSQNIVIAWNGVDTANADLKCWTVTESAITACTDVVANGTDDQGLAAIGIDESTGYWWAAYCGKSDGSQTWSSSTKIYCKVSQDGGTTWGAEDERSQVNAEHLGLWCAPRFTGDFAVLAAMNEPGLSDYQLINVSILRPRLSSQWIG
jgi:hypothetical protein